MAEEIINPPESVNGINTTSAPMDTSQIHPQILSQTLGQLLQNNQAQGMIMKAMQINPQQLQQMLQASGNNQMMNMTIGDLFKNGTMQQSMTANPNTMGPLAGQAQMLQVSPQQMQQILSMLNMPNQQAQINGQPPQQMTEGQILPTGAAIGPDDKVPYTLPVQASKPSLLQKIKKLFF